MATDSLLAQDAAASQQAVPGFQQDDEHSGPHQQPEDGYLLPDAGAPADGGMSDGDDSWEAYQQSSPVQPDCSAGRGLELQAWPPVMLPAGWLFYGCSLTNGLTHPSSRCSQGQLSHPPAVLTCPRAAQVVPNAELSYEDACRTHIESLVASATATAHTTQLSSRVASWQSRVSE